MFTAPALAFLLVVGACSSDSSSTAESATATSAGTTRTVETELGPVELPTDPERILALDEYAALNLMALGIDPAEVWASYQSEVGAELIESAGIPLEANSTEMSINLEAVAAVKPDVIVGTAEGAFTEYMDQLNEVAPTVILPYSRPWREVVTETGRIFDREEEGAELITALDGRIDDLKVGDDGQPAPSMSLLGVTYSMIFAPSNKAPLSTLLDELGYARPDAQTNGKPDPTFDAAVMLSEEVLGDHDADQVVVFEGVFYDPQPILDSPTFKSLPAVQAGRVTMTDGDMWFGTYPFAIAWILDDIEAMQANSAAQAAGETVDNQTGIGTVADTMARYTAFEELR